MTLWQRVLVGILLTIALFAIDARLDHDRTFQPTPAPTVACQEGDSCWNCDTMGNGICGERLR